MLIYLIVYTVQNNNYIFSDDFINKAKEILSYDTNFMQIYDNTKNGVMAFLILIVVKKQIIQMKMKTKMIIMM